MKKIVLSIFLSVCTLITNAQDTFKLAHGPYLQEVTNDGATIVFLTSAKAFSWVELKPHGVANEQAVRYYESKDGLKAAFDTFNAIRIENLNPGKSYDYRILSKEMRDFQPYKVTYGDSITTPWYTFSTVNPAQKGSSIFVTSDMHTDAVKLEKLLELADYKTCDAYFYAGDMMNYLDNTEAIFTSFIDVSVEKFAKNIPFEVVRGNHETRGSLARSYSRYFPKKNGKIYGSYLLGDVMIVMLDSGEDKAEDHWVYAGLTDFNAYRTEQAQWLKEVVNSKEYKKAKYHIVISHFPMVIEPDTENNEVWHGWQDAINKFLPILNKAKVDLLVSGHTHRYSWHDADKINNQFPILVQGAMCAARLDLKDGNIHIKVIDINGNILKETLLKAQ